MEARNLFLGGGGSLARRKSHASCTGSWARATGSKNYQDAKMIHPQRGILNEVLQRIQADYPHDMLFDVELEEQNLLLNGRNLRRLTKLLKRRR